MGRQYNEEFKKQIVAASYVDGVSVASVAQRFEVNDSAIYYWRKRFGRPIDESTTSVSSSSDFIPIVISDEEAPVEVLGTDDLPSLNSWQVTISMGSDRQVDINGAFELPDLIKLIRGVAV